MAGDRETLRTTFDEDAARYDRARPTYPAALFDEIDRRLATPAPRTLEIGCGTGQATVPLARRGHRIVAVELGADLARVARRRLAAFPDVDVVHADVERWDPGTGFDLVVCATAFHWLDPRTRLSRVARLLRPGGLLALVQTLHVSGPSAAFFAAVQRSCYERWDPDTPPGLRLRHLDELPPVGAYGLEDAAEFDGHELRRFPVDLRYDANRYLDLLRTFSNHRALPDDRRAGLFACLRRHIEAAPDGIVVRSVAFELATAVARQ